MKIALFDIEATGLDVDTVDVHCIALLPEDRDPAVVDTYPPPDVKTGVEQLQSLVDTGWTLAGHNIIEYDLPVLRRHGLVVPPGQVYDTLVVSRAIYPGTTLVARDKKHLRDHPRLQGELIAGAHSLAAWGMRLGCPKDNYTGGWETYSQEMMDYCAQDVVTNRDVLRLFRERIPDAAAQLECEVAQMCRDMRLKGVEFDVNAALELASELAEKRAVIAHEMRGLFAPWLAQNGPKVTPKKTMRRKVKAPAGEWINHVMAGAPYTKIKEVQFNPASTDHIAGRLQAVHGWNPKQFTDGGKPKVTAEILRDLPYPEASELADYQELKKILGYLSEGNNAWLKLEKHGRLHGKINPTGTVSGRGAHSRPNLGNVPTRSELGHKCRQLFVAAPGKVIVGADASGLQLRLLAHYLAPWDAGAFCRQCESGDTHEYMRGGTGLFTRDRQKTWTYAMLFGAGDGLLGKITIDDWHYAFDNGLTEIPPPKLSKARAQGKRTKANLGNAFPAFPMLDKALKGAAKRGSLFTLDGRDIPVQSEHTAIAMLLQAGEAVIMKRAMVLARDAVRDLGGHHVLWVHDENQIEAPVETAEEIGATLVQAIVSAGEYYDLNVKLDGDAKIGPTWADTH